VPYVLVAGAAYAAMGAILLRRLPALAEAPLRDLGLRRPDAAAVAVACIALAAVVVLRFATFWYLVRLGLASHVQAGIGQFHPTGAAAAALVVLVGAAVAPFCEELLYRATLYRFFAAHLSGGAAILLSALVFAAARLDYVLFPFFAAYGVLLAIAYRRTNNLWVPVLIRCGFDGASYALLVALAYRM
jgi:membrane protease YdiL (CAAX protease family)